MYINRMEKDNPCTRDCPERFADTEKGITCHAVCPRFKTYRVRKDRECRARFEENERSDVRTEYRIRMTAKYKGRPRRR